MAKVKYQALEARDPDFSSASPLMVYGPFRDTPEEAHSDIPAGASGFAAATLNWKECREAQRERGEYPWQE